MMAALKRPFAWCAAHILYHTGDALSKVSLEGMYPAYNWMVLKAYDLCDEYEIKLRC